MFSKTPLREGFEASFPPLLVGVRSLMMDFGFGTFLDKFEDRFGRIATTVLLTLIAGAIVAFCLNVLFTSLLSPAFLAIQRVMLGSQDAVTNAWDLLKSIMWIGIFLFLIINVRSAIELVTFTKRTEGVAERILEIDAKQKKEVEELVQITTTIVESFHYIEQFVMSISQIEKKSRSKVVKKEIDIILRRIGKLKKPSLEFLLSQSPQDTAKKTQP